MTPEDEIKALRETLMFAHQAMTYADLAKNDPKVTRDFLALDKRMVEIGGFFPHRR